MYKTTRDNLSKAIREGRGVIAMVQGAPLWKAEGTNPDQDGPHAVTITDGTFTADGKLESVMTNDTGSDRRVSIPIDDFMNAADNRRMNYIPITIGSDMVVTNSQVFPTTTK